MAARVSSSWQDRRVSTATPPEILALLRQRLANAEVPVPLPSREYKDEDFMMYEFKVRRCPLGRAHEWTSCPYAHPGEAARRRDPRRFGYSGDPCPDLRRRPGATCPRGAGCSFAHGTFETWLHPSRYRTRPCVAGVRCARPVCFFAHTDQELRLVATLSLKPMFTAWDSPPLSLADQGRAVPSLEQVNANIDMEQLIFAMQAINMRQAMQARTTATVLPQATEEDCPELGWVSDLLM